ncbi:CidA/LrgA family protein [Geopsychrobacter electrodiphilus]|uniref:CidA/LrgA family protein n=1 Tax=Geopsychrobacter electrodiphilus TaxID=225196 RepID=UPI00036EB269|nr:CidA/LrgA family protein [Geopsychrobacter electrodiphilus]
MLQGLVLLFGFQFIGELLSHLFALPIPGNVIGMALMLVALTSGIVKEESISEAGELLLKYMALFFVPAGVGVMLYFDLIAREWLPIIVGTVVSTFVVMAVTGWTEQLLGGADD